MSGVATGGAVKGGASLGWLGPLVTGLGSIAGSLIQNKQQRSAADRAMRFSERMSSTAAQRSAADYAAAGLNPALAYDRPASAPQGVTAGVEDVVEKGVSSALTAKRLKAEIELLQQQAFKASAEGQSAAVDATLKSTAVSGEPSYRDVEIARRRDTLRGFAASAALQPHELSLAATKALLERLQLPGARAQSDLDAALGIYGPILKSIPAGPLAALLRKRGGRSGGAGARSVPENKPALTLDGRPLRFGPKRDY